MAFQATKREWSELYAFFRLLSDGQVYAGTPQVKKDETNRLPVAMIQREEHDGTRQYIIEGDQIRVKSENGEKLFHREDFQTVAELILQAIKNSREDEVTSPDGVEEFLDEVAIFDLEAKTDDRTDFSVAFYSADAPLTGLVVRSRMSPMFPLLDGGRSANFKFEQTGIKFANPTVNKINAEGEEDDVLGRMLMIERLGGVLKYNDVADKVFRSNLSMIDLHAGRLFGEMVRLMWLDGITKVSELTEEIKKLKRAKADPIIAPSKGQVLWEVSVEGPSSAPFIGRKYQHDEVFCYISTPWGEYEKIWTGFTGRVVEICAQQGTNVRKGDVIGYILRSDIFA